MKIRQGLFVLPLLLFLACTETTQIIETQKDSGYIEYHWSTKNKITNTSTVYGLLLADPYQNIFTCISVPGGGAITEKETRNVTVAIERNALGVSALVINGKRYVGGNVPIKPETSPLGH